MGDKRHVRDGARPGTSNTKKQFLTSGWAPNKPIQWDAGENQVSRGVIEYTPGRVPSKGVQC